MKFKYDGLVHHLVIILVFFVCMMGNFFLLFPIMDKEEALRFVGDIDRYASYFQANSDRVRTDSVYLDSLLSVSPNPYGGRFMIMDSEGFIIYDDNDHSGSAFDILYDDYGQIATDLLTDEIANPTPNSKTVYDYSASRSLYASYEPSLNIVFFYAADYSLYGSRMMPTFRLLLIIMILGGTVLIVISLSNIKKLTRDKIYQTANDKELETASAIQRAMLPRESRHLLQLDIDAKLLPAKKVGGDLYYYVLREGVLYFCVGDVSGKGIPASLCMSRMVSLFRVFALNGLAPARIASGINDELCINNDQYIFVTAFIGALRIVDGSLVYCNAGHDAPLYWNGVEDSRVGYLKSSPNLPLGFDSSTKYVEDMVVLEKNALLLLYTDGITEAKGKEGMLGRDNMNAIVEKLKSGSAKQISEGLLDEVLNFEKGVEQSDDITLLVLKNIPSPKELHISNDVKELRKIAKYCEFLFEECPLDAKSRILVRSGLDEALTNCVRYAYDTPGNDITVIASIEENNLIIVIKDSGKPFNPLEYFSDAPGTIKIGGLGIQMIRSNFDDVKYQWEDGYNILTLIKNL